MSRDTSTTEKRVLFLNYEYPPLGGGAANATRHILREYVKIGGVKVDLVTSAHDGKTRQQEAGKNVCIHFVSIGNKGDNLHHQSGGDLFLYTWRGFWQAYALMKKEEYDVIHAFFGIPCGFMALILSVMFRVPYIVSLRGSDVPGYSERFEKWYPVLTPIIRLIWRKAGAVVANSQGLKGLAEKTNPKQIFSVIPNGVDTLHFQPEAGESKTKRNNIIITTGATRITERKGLRYLLEAVVTLRNEYPALQVEIMGEGSEKKNLERFVQEQQLGTQVTFLGRIPAEQTPGLYARADIFVLPSFNEGMSNALLEALASGLAAIVTDTGGSQELVTENQNGLYIAVKSSESIVTALRTLLKDPLKRQNFGTESRKRAEAQSWSSVAGRYRALYQDVSQATV